MATQIELLARGAPDRVLELLVVDREQRLVCAAYRRATFTHRVNTLNRDSRIAGMPYSSPTWVAPP